MSLIKFKKFLKLPLIWLIFLAPFLFASNVYSNSSLNGSGTLQDPYRISNCTDLQNMNQNLTASYALANDIDCTDTKNWNSGQGFSPVGTYQNYFTGTLDGKNHVISNLFINRRSQSYVGLFGATLRATISNLGLVNVNITGYTYVGSLIGLGGGRASIPDENGGNISNVYATGNMSGSSIAGGLIGSFIGGNVTNSYFNGNARGNSGVGGLIESLFAGSVVSNCHSSGSVYALNAGPAVGGLIGRMYYPGKLSNSYSTANVEVSGGYYVGGLVGGNFGGNISNSYATGTVTETDWGKDVGGLVGANQNGGLISNSYATGAVTGAPKPSQTTAGGLVGTADSSSISNSYSIGAVKNDAKDGKLGGLVGFSSNSKISDSYYNADTSGQHDTGKGIPKSTSEMQQQSTFQGWDFLDTWTINESSGYPGIKATSLNLSIAQISSSQKVGSPIFISISANDNHFNGRVYLNSANGDVYPEYVNLTNGSFSGYITLYDIGLNNVLWVRWDNPANSGLNIAESNAFDLADHNGQIPSNATLTGKITNSNGGSIANANIQIFSGDPSSGGIPIGSFVTSDQNGNYTIANVPAGQFYMSVKAANYQDYTDTIGLGAQRTMTRYVTLLSQNLSSGGVNNVPVLLIPGIMGSTTSEGWDPYPRLPFDSPPKLGWRSSKLKLLDPFDQVGWYDLTLALKSAGYQISYDMFEMPYDWTLSVPAIRDQYLVKWIKWVKERTGSSQVDIVAHSMGGLVVRSYIQSNNYANDVRKFAMVGTPNYGSDKAYYVWEGGDPKSADEVIKKDTEGIGKYFYSNTIHYLIEKRKKDSSACKFNRVLGPYTPKSCKTGKIYDYAHNAARSVGGLMPTYDNALQNNAINQPIKFEENTLLQALNGLPCNGPKGCVDVQGNFYSFNSANKIMTSDSTGVQTKLFIGTEQNTLSTILISPQPEGYNGKFYKDGIPQKNILGTNGDGTVLDNSVRLYSLPELTKSEEHGKLIKKFKDDIISFLKGGGFYAFQENTSESRVLVIEIIGQVQPAITSIQDESGKSLELKSNNEQDEFDLDSASIGIKNPSNSAYTVSLQSPTQEAYELNVNYVDVDSNIAYGTRVMGFFDNTLKTFSFKLDATQQNNQIIFDRSFSTPTNLTIQNSNNYVRLNWEDSVGNSNKDVDYYEIFYKIQNTPYYSFLGRTQKTEKQYTSGLIWPDSENNIYMVRAILTNGKSTFFSNQEFLDDNSTL